MAKKMELIKQIRLLEKYVMSYKPKVNLTEVPNYGLLGEMSIVELNQRLFIAKEAAKETEEQQRQLILKRKKEKEEMLKKFKEEIEIGRQQRLEQRKKSELRKIEKQKKLSELLNEKSKILASTYDNAIEEKEISSNSIIDLNCSNRKKSTISNCNYMISNDPIQNLVYQLKQRKESKYIL